MKKEYGLDKDNYKYLTSETESENECLTKIDREKQNGILIAITFIIFFGLLFILLMAKICPCK
jgi:hypothetical protein